MEICCSLELLFSIFLRLEKPITELLTYIHNRYIEALSLSKYANITMQQSHPKSPANKAASSRRRRRITLMSLPW